VIISQVSSDYTAAAKSAYQSTAARGASQSVASVQPGRSSSTPSSGKDTVELSGSALAQSLKTRGFSVEQIALQMGVDVSTVSSYLKITTKAGKDGQRGESTKSEVAGVSNRYQNREERKGAVEGAKPRGVESRRQTLSGDQQLKTLYNESKPVYEQLKPKTFTVERPGDARAKSLKFQGYSVAEISQRMGVDVDTVKKYIHKT